MRFQSSLFALPLLFCAVGVSIQPVAVQAQTASARSQEVNQAWGFNKSDLQPDPAILYGLLPNGMRYAIMKNETPKGNASVRLHFNIGSTAEADDQRGLAHFLEHMAFNGSKKVPEGEMVKLLQRLGLAFGADTNASTGFTETQYKLDLPEIGDTHVDTALMLMRETASELTIDPKAVDRERGVILGEKRTRNSPQLRQLEAQIGFLAPGTLPTKRLPIGTEEVIQNAPAQRLRDFYESYYTPARATLFVVGDVDPAKIEAKVKAQFADWKAKRPPAADPVMGKVNPTRPLSATSFVEPSIPTITVINTVKGHTPELDTAATRAQRLAEGIGAGILSRRFATLARATDPVIVQAGMSNSPFFKSAEVASLFVVAKGGDWKTALATGEQELRRALQHGFTQAELNEQVANIRASLKNAVDQASTRRNTALVGEMIGALEPGRIITHPSTDLARFEALAPRLGLAEINSAFRAIWSGANPQIFVAHTSQIEGGDNAIKSAWETSAKVAVAPPQQGQDKKFAYTSFGTAGALASDSRIADLDVRTLRFANNVRLNIKKTDFEKGVVRVSLRVGGGLLEFPQSPDGIAQFAQLVMSSGGVKAHSIDELQTLMAGRAVQIGIGAQEDHFGAAAGTTTADLETQLQLFAAFVNALDYRPEGEAQWRNIVTVGLPTLDTTPQGVAERDVPRIIASGDTREGIPSNEVLKPRSYAELRPLIEKSLASGPIEIGIVGDVKEEDAIAVVAKTFGALPARMADRPNYAALSPRRFPTKVAPANLTHGGKADQAMVQTYWAIPDGFDRKTRSQVRVLAAVTQLMVTEELREKLGATYSPRASASPSEIFKGYGYLNVSALVAPDKTGMVLGAIDNIAKRLASQPVSSDLLNRARTPMLETVQRSLRDNGSWISTIDEAQTVPADLDEMRNADAMLKAVTAADLQKLAKRYLRPNGALRVQILPRAAK